MRIWWDSCRDLAGRRYDPGMGFGMNLQGVVRNQRVIWQKSVMSLFKNVNEDLVGSWSNLVGIWNKSDRNLAGANLAGN